MQKLLRIFLCASLAATAIGASTPPTKKNAAKKPAAASTAPSRGEEPLIVEVTGLDAIKVTISGSPELTGAAITAFKAHGHFLPVASGGQYDLRFTTVAPNQVRVDVLKGGQSTLSQIANGSSQRNALFRAADLAVKAITGAPGFFASKLAFVSERSGHSEIFVSDLFMGEARQITHDNAHALTPRWSPDGSKLLYTSFFKSGFPDIFQIDLGSMQRTTFASFKGTNSGARYSPNGAQVAMVLSGSGNPEIYVSDAQGRHPVRRTFSDTVESSPCFSPDGSQIVFASEPGPQLYIMPTSGGSPRRVTSGLSSYCAEPDWSRAEPNKIAFTFREGRVFQIGVLDLRTGVAKKVSKAAFDGVEPCWLADGRHLIYTARSANSRRLFILDTESGRTAELGKVEAEKASVTGP